MLSTAQAVKEWDTVLILLNEARSHAAAHPDQQTLPEGLEARMARSVHVLNERSRGLASPHATWKQMLKQKIPYLVLGACSELMATNKYEPTIPARSCAALLLAHAKEALPPLAPSSNSSSSSSSSSGGGGGGGLTAMLWEQLEQSGFLQQLPHQLSCILQDQHTVAGTLPRQASSSVERTLGRHTVGLMHLLESLETLQPSCFTAHAGGQQCVVPATQLGFSSLQYISTALTASVEQTGERQDWMPELVDFAVRVTGNAAIASRTLMGCLHNQRPTGASHNSSSGGSSSSNSGSREVALAMLRAEQTTQWACLGLAVPMLAHYLQRGGYANTFTGSSSSSSSGTSSGRNSGSASSTTTSTKPAGPWLGGWGDQWLPVALAPTMPAAYSSMLEQLGISREVGLWLAARLSCAAVDVEERGVKGLSKQQQTAFTQSAHGIVLGGMEQYHLQQQALMTNGVLQPHTAALHLSVSAIALPTDWLSY